MEISYTSMRLLVTGDATGFTGGDTVGILGRIFSITDVSYANNGEAVAGFKLLKLVDGFFSAAPWPGAQDGGTVTTVVNDTLSDVYILNYTSNEVPSVNISSFVATPNLHADVVTQTGTS